jgi:hypothetical protein
MLISVGFAALVTARLADPSSLLVTTFLLGAASRVVMMATLFVSAQVALPEWVRGRGLAVFLTVYFGAMTLGSAAGARSPTLVDFHLPYISRASAP